MGTKYNAKFKEQLMRQHVEGKRSVAEPSEAYGIGDGPIYKWIKAYREDPAQARPGSGHQKAEGDDVRKLRRKVLGLEDSALVLAASIGVDDQASRGCFGNSSTR